MTYISKKEIFLFTGLFCFLLSSVAFQVNVFGWFTAVGLLYFSRGTGIIRGTWVILAGLIIMTIIKGALTSPLPLYAVALLSPISVIPLVIPYLVDRWLLDKSNHVLIRVFLFPTAAVTCEYLMSLMLGAVGAVASTQVYFLAFVQLASVTGVFGISFMMYWFATLAYAHLTEQQDKVVKVRNTFIVLFGAILIFGWIKIKRVEPLQKTVRVAGIAVEAYAVWDALYKVHFNGTFNMDITKAASADFAQLLQVYPTFLAHFEDEQYRGVRKALRVHQETMFDRTRKEAQNGAKILVWSETALMIFPKEEATFIQRLKQIALEESVTITASIALMLSDNGDGVLYENKSFMVTANGIVSDTFFKARPAPILDASIPGDGIMGLVPTEYGTLTQAICYDADFPDLIEQAGEADILMLPSKDWLGISPFHADIAIFRAIENGISIVRPTSTGMSVIYDPHGRIVAKTEAYDQEVRVLNGYVPIQGISTLYNNGGYIFPILSILGLILLLMRGLFFKADQIKI